MTNAIMSFLGNPYVVAALALCGALGTIAGVIRLINAVGNWRNRVAAKRLGESIRKSSGMASFTDADIELACKNYIPPNCTQVDPSDEGDLRNVVALAPLFESVDKHLAAGGEKRHLMLLADSGMGKTTFCINYYARHSKTKEEKRHSKHVAVVPLGRTSAIEQIGELKEKRDTVLFLDAFDEDPKAIGREGERLVELMKASSDFKNIVVTCRSQFFSSDDAIPKGSGIMYAAPRRAGQSREFPLHKLFLAPLTKEQIDLYLSKRFPYRDVRNWRLRGKAKRIVSHIPELSVRPMLLELLPDLALERRTIDQLFDLYGFLIAKWLEREKDWIEEQHLFDISVELAVRTFLAQRAGRGDRMSPHELESIAREFNSTIDGWKLKSRSLLNRDIEGNFKFAHRSVMEYLFLVAALRRDERCYEVEWTDLMKDLLVSFGNMPRPPFQVDIEEVLNMARPRTGIWPLATPLRTPRRISRTEAIQALRSDSISSRHARKIPVTWRNAQTRVTATSVTPSATSYLVEDPTHGLEWNVIVTSAEDRKIFAEAYSPPGKEIELERGGRMYIKRLPSLDEMITLWEAHCFALKAGQSLLTDDEIYWIGDSGDVGPLCCSTGREPLDRPYLALMDSKAGDAKASFHLYEFGNRYGHVGRQPFNALVAHLLEPKLVAQVDA